MRIFVTGNKGFIGSKFLNYLIETNIEHRNRAEHYGKSKFQVQGYDICEGRDIRDKYLLDYQISDFKPDVVVHMAARTSVVRGRSYPDEYISTNINGTKNVVDMCNKHKVKRLIFFSSSSVFGPHESPVEELFPKNPISIYGITKLAGELIVNTAECETVAIRPFTVYGSRGKKDAVIYKWIDQIKKGEPITIYGDLESYRGYVYIKDLMDVVVHLIDAKLVRQHEDFNLGGSEKIYLRDIIDVFEEFVPSLQKEFIPRPTEDIVGQTANVSKAKAYLSFEPRPLFVENLRNILKYERMDQYDRF